MENWPYLEVPDDELRVVRFKPAFHRCHPEPSKNYGIGGVRMLWVLRVGDWAIDWDVSTDWGLPDEAFRAAAPDCTHRMHRNGYPSMGKASGGAVCWHSPVPMWEDGSPTAEHCPIIGRACYTDNGFLLADEVFDMLRVEGDDAVWKYLRSLLDERRTENASLSGS